VNDNDLLDLIAGRAPAPASDLTDRVLAAGRGARRRRRRLAVAGAAVCAVIAVLAPVVAWNVPGDRDTITPQATQPTTAGPDRADSADLYAPAIQAILSEAMPAATIARFDLLDHLCENVLAPDEPCVAAPLPSGVRESLAGLSSKQVTFVPDDSGLGGPVILITLGPIRWVRDDLAEVPVSFRQAGQDAIARSYRFQIHGGSWILTS
jgi:hypothetical protein